MNVLIIGGGRIGTTLENIVKKNTGISPLVWDIDPQKRRCDKNFEESVADADLIFYCAPAMVAKEYANVINENAKNDIKIAVFSKGISLETGELMSELWQSNCNNKELAFIGGPMMAEDITTKIGVAVVASASMTVYEALKQLLDNTKVILLPSQDKNGVALCGVLKNIYAVAMGIAEGLDMGTNAKGLLATRSLEEMHQIADIIGTDRKTIDGPAGVGDYVATAFSKHSANLRAGLSIANNAEEIISSEGVKAIPIFRQKLIDKNQEVPKILDCLDKIIKGEIEANQLECALLGTC